MRRDLDIRLLRTLVTIVDTGGFRRAAENLHMSQPAVSQHVRRLEGLIGGSVFHETGRSLRLSLSGEELLQYARRLVRLNDELVGQLSPTRTGRRLVIGVCDTLAGILPVLLSEVSERHLQSMLTVRTGESGRLAEQVASGAADMAMLLQPPRTAQDRWVGHLECAWFGEPAALAADSLPVAVVAEPCPLRRLTEEALEAGCVPRRTTYEGVGLEGVVAANRSGLGVSLLFAGAAALWGLSPIRPGTLPEPARPLPVTLAVAPGVRAGIADSVVASARHALRDHPVRSDLLDASDRHPTELTAGGGR
ncbi:LysR family transcriptional regulator [Streptomyces sp. NPDC005279]|uniref:LysR family transcriptional regulator n=1 Tax=Streptomyces sp. NPDC005279 TaxID=3364712 RepID=UPI0036B8C95C